MKKILSIVLALAMTLSLCSTAFAAEVRYDDVVDEVITAEDIEISKDVYDALSPEARAIFNDALARDMELLQFHKAYVDPSSDIVIAPQNRARAMAATAATDPMTVLNTQLALLSLPTSVVYTLKAMGAGMIAAIADGPLPVGEILLAAATVSAAVAIVANWQTVSPKWNSVVNAFKKAFAASATNVVSAFQTLRENVLSEYKVNFNKSTEDAINGADANKQNHILNNKLHKNGHDWKNIFNGKDPKWSNLAPVLIKVLNEGSEHSYNGSSTVFERELYYNGVTVVVRFVKDAEGFVKWLSTAYLK